MRSLTKLVTEKQRFLFTLERHLVTAMMVSTSEKKQKKYVCKLCGVYFTSEFCHFLHLHVHADDSSKLYKFPCDSCDKKFKKASQLKCHKTTCRGAAESGGKDESGNLSKSTSSASKPRFSSRPTVTTVKGVRKKYQKALFRGKQKRKAGQIRQTTGKMLAIRKAPLAMSWSIELGPAYAMGTAADVAK